MNSRLAPIPLAEIPDDHLINLPWVESPFFERRLAEKQCSEAQRRIASAYNRDGFCVIPDAASPDLCDQVIAETDPLNYPEFIDGQPSFTRVQDAWRQSTACKRLATLPGVLEVLEFLYNRRAVPFQTLNFKVGTQQPGHSDAIHFNSLPSRFMCGVWIALEDVDSENGPLFYYPRSHRAPEFDLYDFGLSVENPDYPEYERAIAALVKALKLEPKQLTIKKGSGLVWSSNLIHGGSKVLDPKRTRRSQVTHYFFDRCIYYTPLLSNRVTGEYAHRSDVIDIRTGQPAPQSYNGREFHAIEVANGRKCFRFASAPSASTVPAGPFTVASPEWARIAHLEAKVAELERELSSVVGSRSYRLGRAISTPYRLAKRIIGAAAK